MFTGTSTTIMPAAKIITNRKGTSSAGHGVAAGRETVHDFLQQRQPLLDTVFAPKVVALIGASEAPGSVGRTLMENLRGSDFGGAVYPVNPKRARVLGVKTCARIADVPGPVDLAVIATPAATVPGVIAECAEAGVKSAVIISAGFRETGRIGCELESQILAHARRAGMRIIGPNCLGVMLPQRGLNATFAATMARPGSVAFLSQSGALCTAILDWSLRENVGFSAFVSLGSMLDVGWGDLIDYLGDDPNTKSIVCYMESIGDARAFLSAAREVSFTKPIIVIKVGHTDAAAKAAASHTGSLTGSDAALDAAFRRVGVLRVNTIEELFDMAEVLAKQPRPHGPRLAVVTNAGGPGALATDMLVTSGGQLAALAPDTIAALDGLLPPAWSHGNPIDILGAADARLYDRATQLALRDPNTDGVLVVLTPQAMTDSTGTAKLVAALAESSTKPVLASWMGGASLDPARVALNAARVPTYDYPDAAARAFSLMWRYSDNLRLLYERPVLPAAVGDTIEDRSAAARLISAARQSGRTLLTEVESKSVLAAYGIFAVETLTARSEDEAIRCGAKLGYPVVLKVLSETITHKTDVGGVALDLHNSTAVRRAWNTIKRSVTEMAGAKHFGGVTVQRMIPRDGIELILGSSIDPQLGPVLLFGAGGELVEIMQDRALGLPPLTLTLARRLMERTRIFRALAGVRGHKAVDIGALTQLLVSFSHLIVEQRWIAELDINPLLANSDRLMALDARIVLQPANLREDQLPRPAIRPYPARYIKHIQLKDGSHVTLRPIRPEDEDMLVAFHATLSNESVYHRYFGVIPLKTRVAHDRLVRICFSDYDRELAIVAEHENKGATRELIGVGRLNRARGRNEAEFALVVSDAWQGRGLGARLLEVLTQIGRAENLSRITGLILPDNQAMLNVCRRIGFHLRHDVQAGEFEAEFPL
jgi:acetyltransferase